MNKCLFCDPNDLTKSAKVKESEHFILRLDPFPVSYGHILIIPKRHVEKINELESDEIKKLKNRISDAKKLSQNEGIKLKQQYFQILGEENEKSEDMIKAIIAERNSPDGFNIGINEGEAAGQTIDHLHIHVIPRYEGDVENPEGGVRNVIPDKADYT